MLLRDATPDDAARIGEAHFLARAEAYTNLLPPERVNWRTLAERQEQWRSFLVDPGYGRDRFLAVLESEGNVAGFAAGGPQRYGDPSFPGEVWSIYLRDASRGQGHGRTLMSEMARRLLGAGFPALIVWTQAPNAHARGFYEHMGGAYVRSRAVRELEIVGYGWPDLRALLPPEPPRILQL